MMRVAYAILGTAMLLLAWPFMLILAAFKIGAAVSLAVAINIVEVWSD